MKEPNPFAGFTRDTLVFFRELAQNNEKPWFETNKERYEKSVMAPARSLVAVLGDRLTKVYPGINADARVNRSIFRIYRDTRFSRDKSPYKTHLGILLWEGPGKKMECPGFYVHVEAERIMLAGGLYMFSRDQLGPYRDAVTDPDFGPKLAGALEKTLSATGAALGGGHYKRTPRGYDANHPTPRCCCTTASMPFWKPRLRKTCSPPPLRTDAKKPLRTWRLCTGRFSNSWSGRAPGSDARQSDLADRIRKTTSPDGRAFGIPSLFAYGPARTGFSRAGRLRKPVDRRSMEGELRLPAARFEPCRRPMVTLPHKPDAELKTEGKQDHADGSIRLFV